MKSVFIFLINFYQCFLAVGIKSMVGVSTSCRFTPTCSEYSKNIIQEKGVCQGLLYSFKRILSCQPFYNTKLLWKY